MLTFPWYPMALAAYRPHPAPHRGARAAMTAGAVTVTALMLVPLALLAEPALALWGQTGCPFLAVAAHVCGCGVPVSC